MLDLLQLRNRRRFFDHYGSRPGEQQAALPPRGIRFSCPCCGYPTLGGRGTDEICELCWWEDDGVDDNEADEEQHGPNAGYSLNEARMNFQVFGVMFPQDNDPRIGGPDDETTRATKAQLIGAFSAMVDEPPSDRLNELWDQVRILERALNAQLKRRLKS
ncbi:MAG TPA: CPCC family cysteine-rich protein [Candidatus Angelobacter sp.]